ncbi:MAG: hypothetical protein PF572_03720 [Patescibacteria group bacterium]|jgi:hypothetical protein|nr:hypothetical protein [Patescibacteria group bacterium]
MKKYKLKFENLELYTFIILAVFIGVASVYFYGFIDKNVYKTITSSEIFLDASSIRISDVNISKFNNVSANIVNKASSKKVNSRNVFE